MSDVLQAVALFAICVWIIGTAMAALIGLLEIIISTKRDDAKVGLLMFFLPFLWPLALAGIIVVNILVILDDAKTEGGR